MSTEIQTTGDPYLELIREVTGNPELSAEKLKILVDMRLLLEDRESAKLFDAAMFTAQDEIKGLKWDKRGGSQNRYVSYPKIDQMLRPIRRKHGFTQSWDTEPGPTPDLVILCSDVSHVGGHKRRYRTPMPIDGQGPKGGGVMTKNQAVNAGTSYGMRNLSKMIWDIPMLIDEDDKDGAENVKTITKSQVADLRALAEEVKADIPKFCEYFKVDKIENLPATLYASAVKAFEKKRKQAS